MNNSMLARVLGDGIKSEERTRAVENHHYHHLQLAKASIIITAAV